MKFGKIMIVSLILLAILTIGAVSASESTDTLNVDDGEELSVDESPGGELSDGESPEVLDFEDIQVGVDRGHRYSSIEADNDPVICIETPMGSNGTVVVSSGSNEFINKQLKDFDNDVTWTDDSRNIRGYNIYNHDLNFFKGLENGDIVKISFFENQTQVTTTLLRINFEDNSFYLDDCFYFGFTQAKMFTLTLRRM